MLIAGSCHCGNVSFQLRWLPEPTEITARSCTCTFCTKHGGVWTSCPEGELTVSIREPARWSRYTFGTKTAEFHVCSHCGAVPVVTSQIDGEDEKVRLARRKRNWIGRVTFIEGDA